MPSERGRLPLLLLSLLAERPMHGYEVNEEIERRAVRQWADVGVSSVYQTLDRLAAQGLLRAEEQATPAQGPPSRTIYTISEDGRTELRRLARMALASTEHQRFAYDLGVGVACTHLPLAEVRQALERRREAIRTQAQRAAAACAWAERMVGAWVVLDHQRRALETEVYWLDDVIDRLAKEETA